ncbi:MAG: SH3 domain-containing protein [Caldilineaceae bacterium]
MAFLIAACGGKTEPTENIAQAPMREARPTFTATVGVPLQPAPSGDQQSAATQPAEPATDQSGPQPAEQNNNQAAPTAEATSTPAPTTASKASVLINEELVNTRTGPGLNYDLVDMVEKGQTFEITGKTVDGGWWQICCVKSQKVWVVNQFVQTSGDVNSVAVIDDLPGSGGGGAPVAAATPVPQSVAANPTPAPQPTATAAPPPPAAPAFGFDLIAQEQFPDTNVVHIFLFVFEGANALPGYSLRVSHNGTELPTDGQTSIGPQAALTWPIPDGRQRLQNLKLEFPGQQPGGTWEAQLMLNGQAAGPVATFKLGDSEPNRELYVRYQKK